MKSPMKKESFRNGFLRRAACWLDWHRKEQQTEASLLIHEKGNRNVAAFIGKLYLCECGRERFEGSNVPVYEGHWTGFLEWKRANWTMTKPKIYQDVGKLLPFKGKA